MKRPFEFGLLFLLLQAVTFSAPFSGQTQNDSVAENMIKVGRYSLFFKVYKGTGPTILLESGGGMDSSEWDKVAPVIAKDTGATVVSYDRAGFGKSDLPATPYEIREEVAVLWRALQNLALDRDVILVGHSYGGLLNRLTAAEHPERIKGIVFVDPFSVEFVDAVGGPDVVDRFMGKPEGDTSQPEKLTKQQKADLRFTKNPLADKLAAVRKTAYLQNIPVRVITSGKLWMKPPIPEEFQQMWRRSHESMTAAMKGAKLVVAEQSDHMIPFRQPELVVSAVIDVIREAKIGK